MITAICLNPCIDKMVKVSSFQIGGLNRILETTIDGSGKGVNVAIACKQLSCEAACIGFLYDKNGDIIQKRLNEYDVKSDFHWSSGEVRINMKVADIKNGTYTEINEKGMQVTKEQMDFIKEKVREYALKSSILVFTGSLPPGCPTNFYRTLIDEVQPLGVKCFLDAEGNILTEGIQGIPYLIKPNKYELELAAETKLKDTNDIYKAVLPYLNKGISIVAVSMGGEGAFITNGTETYYAPVLPVHVKSTVGAGDSMVAGFCKAVELNMSLEDIFRYGVAAATASVMTEGTRLVNEDDFNSLLEQVHIQKL